MTSAEMSATAVTAAVTTAAVTTAAVTAAAVTATAVTTAAASRQRRTRQQGRDDQNRNSNAGLRHLICSGLIAHSKDAGRNRKFPAPKSAQGPKGEIFAASRCLPLWPQQRDIAQ